MKFCPFTEGWPYLRGSISTKRVHLGLREVAFIEECPHVRGGLYEGFILCIPAGSTKTRDMC